MFVLITLFGASVGAIMAAWGGSSQQTSTGMESTGLQLGTVVAGLVGGAVVGLVLAVIATLWSWFGGSNAILRMTGATQIQKSDDPQLFNVVEELSIAAGIPMPGVYVINDPGMNAFATGRDPEHGVVAITTGLRQNLNRDELAGVMAHEISHIRHYDIRLGMLMATRPESSSSPPTPALHGLLQRDARRWPRQSQQWNNGGANPSRSSSWWSRSSAILAPICAVLVDSPSGRSISPMPERSNSPAIPRDSSARSSARNGSPSVRRTVDRAAVHREPAQEGRPWRTSPSRWRSRRIRLSDRMYVAGAEFRPGPPGDIPRVF